MKVLQVIDKSFLGGGQTVVRNFVLGFRGTDVEALVACRDGGPLVQAVRELGARVHPVPFDKRFRPGPARRMADIVRAEGVDVVHAHGLVAAFYCVLARQFFGMRAALLYHLHGFHHHNYGFPLVGLRKSVERAVCRRVDRVIAVSQFHRGQLEERRYASPDRISLLYSGIPETRIEPAEVEAARREAGLRMGQPVVGVVARLHPQKGIDVFLRAACLVRESTPDVAFVIVGSGEMESALRGMAAELQLADAVHFMGSRAHFAPFLGLFEVAVLPSLWEGLPVMLLEYAAAGLAIVSTNVDGCPDVIGPREGEVVPPGDATALAGAIVRLLRDPGLRAERGRAARERYATTFGLPVTIERFRALYLELIHEVTRH